MELAKILSHKVTFEKRLQDYKNNKLNSPITEFRIAD